MGISLSPASWILDFSKNVRERDLKIAEYLDRIAEEADSLASVWENTAREIMTNGKAKAGDHAIWIKLIERPEWTIYSKNIPRSRLEIFYDRLSNVLGQGVRGDLDYLICKIGAILQKRNLTREIVEAELKKIKGARSFDRNHPIKERITITESVSLLNHEVSVLKNFATDFRNKI